MPDQLTFKQGDEQWTKLRTRALGDLYWFCDVVLGYGDRIPMRSGVHALFCKFVEKKTGQAGLDQKRMRKIEMPRETGKTTIVTQGYTIQRICQNPNIAILLANEKEQNAKDFLSEIKHQFSTNEFLRALFPEVIPTDLNDTTWSASRIIVQRTSGRKEPTVSVIGVGGTVTGMHYDLIICDDIISREAMENARAGSWQIMHQVNRWIHQLEPLLNSNAQPFPELLFIGTRWWHKDCYEHIEEAFGYGDQRTPYLLRWKLPSGEIQQVQAVAQGDLAMFRRAAIEDGRSIFPEKWDLDRLAKIRQRDEALFACNFMNNPSDEVTSTFKADWLLTYDWVNDDTLGYTDGTGARRTAHLTDLDRLIFVDPGGFSTNRVDDRARAAIVVTGTREGTHFLLAARSEKDSFLNCIQQLAGYVSRFSPRKVVIEQAGQQAAFIELVRRELIGMPCSIESVSPKGIVKEQRILGLEPYFQQGRVYLGKGPEFHEFRTQYTQFPRSGRVDLLDALAYLPQFAKKQGLALDPAKRIAEERRLYYERRGLPMPA